MSDFDKVQETARFLRSRKIAKPDLGIVLGTGLGRLGRSIRNAVEIEYAECPHFPRATAVGHAGRLVYGTLAGKKVLALEGRFHFYEGYSLREIAHPVRVLAALGAKLLILSNAAGGLNPLFRLGDIMAVTDHINLMGDSPLAGPNDERIGPRFPDMSGPYDRRLAEAASKAAMKLGIALPKGVYAGVKGPNLETRAEYRFLRMIGADAVGMSTVPEVIAAVHAGLKVLAFSCITDLCFADALEPVDIQKILRVAGEAEPRLTRLVTQVVKGLP